VKTPAGWIGATISQVCNSKSWNFLVFKIGIISGHPVRQNSPYLELWRELGIILLGGWSTRRIFLRLSRMERAMSDDSERRTKPISFNVTPVQNEQIERAAASEGLATASYVRRVVVTHLAKQQTVAA
jgi:hypothetical protein